MNGQLNRQLASVVFIVLFGMLSACSSPELQFSDGSRKSLEDFRGGWLLINYWAIWCKPCIEEIPELNALNNDKGYQVLGFNFDRESGERLEKQVRELEIEFPLLQHDPAQLFEQPQPPALPATLVVSPEGEFHSWLMGPQKRDEILGKLQE